MNTLVVMVLSLGMLVVVCIGVSVVVITGLEFVRALGCSFCLLLVGCGKLFAGRCCFGCWLLW